MYREDKEGEEAKVSSQSLPSISPTPSVTPHLFRGRKDPLSNLWDEESVSVNGVKYISNEQCFMEKKAEVCKAAKLKAAIMKCKDPYEIKRLGDLIDVTSEWIGIEEEYMEKVAKHKFQQCPSYRRALLNTGTRLISENTTNEKWGRGSDGTGDDKMWKIHIHIGDCHYSSEGIIPTIPYASSLSYHRNNTPFYIASSESVARRNQKKGRQERNYSNESSFTSGKTCGEVPVQGSQHDNPHEGDYHRARKNVRHQGVSERSCEPDV